MDNLLLLDKRSGLNFICVIYHFYIMGTDHIDALVVYSCS